MALFISTGDSVADYRTIDIYWGRSSRVWCCRSLLVRVWWGMSMYISIGDKLLE